MEALSTNNMAAECVTRDSRGRITSTTAIAIPAGLTHDEAVAYVRRWNKHEIGQFVQYSF
jgi:Mg/Co/Ni transporter MgtE